MEFSNESNGDQIPGFCRFLAAVGTQKEAALCIANTQHTTATAQHTLTKKGYVVCPEWRTALSNLGEGLKVAITADSISKEVSELFSQYNRRAGMIQIFDREGFVYLSRHISQDTSRLVLVTTDLAIQSSGSTVVSEAGLVFRGAAI